MSTQEAVSQSVPSFEYELLDDDPDHVRTVVASSNYLSPRIEPSKVKLRHRIGRGVFGDVWLATHHQSTKDYDEYHEVAVKMLNPVKEDHMRIVLDKLEDHFYKCQGAKGVCRLYGVSIIGGKLCIIMKFYEGSVADKMARLKDGKLSLPDVLRYGINLAHGIVELHSKEILVLNLKPSNMLLTTKDQAILGDVGIPFLLHGVPMPNTDIVQRLGTPNYMAPEQWQPEVRGPISYETDSWGFACCMIEMLTGVQPWRGKSVDEIFHSVVRKQEKPCIPSGLPPIIENVLLGCFEYDLRSRPLVTDILNVFQSSQHVNSDWQAIGSSKMLNKSSATGHTEWFLSKDHLQENDIVRSRKPLNSCKSDNMNIPDGKIVGLQRETEKDAFVLVRVRGIHDPVRVYASTLERVSFGLAAGDWIRLKEADKKHSPVGILHSIDRVGNVAVAFLGVETLWKGNSSQFQMAESFCVGQFVRIKASILRPRFEWPRKKGNVWATGRIWWILPNGCLMVKFPGILSFKEECDSYMADPAEVEAVNFSTCPGMVKKYQHLEDFHWSVRPVLIAFGMFTAMKLGIAFGKKVGRSKVKKGQGSNSVYCESQHIEGQNANNPAWIPPPVKNILFGDGISTVAR